MNQLPASYYQFIYLISFIYLFRTGPVEEGGGVWEAIGLKVCRSLPGYGGLCQRRHTQLLPLERSSCTAAVSIPGGLQET